MGAKSYYSGLNIELTGWKAKAYDMVRTLDKMPIVTKQKVMPRFNELITILEDFEDRIHKLKSQCPVKRAPDKILLEGNLTHVKQKWAEVSFTLLDVIDNDREYTGLF